MKNNFDQVFREKEDFVKLIGKDGYLRFFGEEVLRFISIAGTLHETFSLGNSPSPDERSITHILFRSIAEKLFYIIKYIHDVKELFCNRSK